MRTPDFLIVGAAKSGTTSLSNYLDRHSQVEIVSNRLEFFGEYSNPSVKELNREAYLDLFDAIPEYRIAGEKSVSYLYSKKAARQIKAMNGGMKIIIILRNPVDRAYSDYWHRRRTGLENLAFEEALAAENERIRKGAPFELHYAHYGLYTQYVKYYLDLFGKEQCRIFLFDDLMADPEAVCGQCFEFLAVRNHPLPIEYKIYNRGRLPRTNRLVKMLFKLSRNRLFLRFVRAFIPAKTKNRITNWMNTPPDRRTYPPMESKTRRALTQFFRPDILALQKVIGRDLHPWLEG